MISGFHCAFSARIGLSLLSFMAMHFDAAAFRRISSHIVSRADAAYGSIIASYVAGLSSPISRFGRQGGRLGHRRIQLPRQGDDTRKKATAAHTAVKLGAGVRGKHIH